MMNKKVQFFAMALGLFVASSVSAQQTVVSQTGGVGPNGGSEYCPWLDNQNIEMGQVGSSYYRVYTIASDMHISTVRVGIDVINISTL